MHFQPDSSIFKVSVMLGGVIPPIFVIEVCQTSFLSHLKVTSCVSYLHCIGCCQVLLTKLHCDKNAFCQLSIKSERFFTPAVELVITGERKIGLAQKIIHMAVSSKRQYF